MPTAHARGATRRPVPCSAAAACAAQPLLNALASAPSSAHPRPTPPLSEENLPGYDVARVVRRLLATDLDR